MGFCKVQFYTFVIKWLMDHALSRVNPTQGGKLIFEISWWKHPHINDWKIVNLWTLSNCLHTNNVNLIKTLNNLFTQKGKQNSTFLQELIDPYNSLWRFLKFWLIDWIVFYTIWVILQPDNGGLSFNGSFLSIHVTNPVVS